MIKTTIVGFGDSLTYGYGVDMNSSYIDRLDKYMPIFYPSISWNIVKKGVNGDNTRDALKRLKTDVLNLNPNIVIVLFGTNDSSTYDSQFCSQLEFEENLSTIITSIKSHNNRTGLNGCIPIPMLVTPPPVIDEKVAPFISCNRIKHYAYIIKKLGEKFHCPVVDFYNYMIEESDGNIENFLQEDGVHLNSTGYDCLYDCIFSEITKLITYEGILKDYNI